MIIAHEILCIALFYSVFCRAVRMDKTTRAEIRFVLLVLGTVAALGIPAPLQWTHWSPDWWSMALLASITALQLVTAWHWTRGVPPRFVNTKGST